MKDEILEEFAQYLGGFTQYLTLHTSHICTHSISIGEPLVLFLLDTSTS